MLRRSSRIFAIVLTLVAVAAAFVAGVWFGVRERPLVPANISSAERPVGLVAADTLDFSPFWRAWKIINDKYVDTAAASSTKKVSDQDKLWGAITGLVDSLGDPYSVFLPPPENQIFEDEISGNFGGIGIELGTRDNALVVIAPLVGTPAARAGILPGDSLIQINDTLVVKPSVYEAVKLIRGPVGTPVKIKIVRNSTGSPLEFNLVRENIKVPTLATAVVPPAGVFVVRLYNFGATAPGLFRLAMKKFVQSGNNKMIIDLRGNPGGFLDAAVDIASWFLPAGAPVAIEDRGVAKESVVYSSKGYNPFDKRLKLIILVDRGTASAAEILAGALAEHNIGILVGEKTFGKGSVQELVPVTPDASLKITIARWLTPHGVSISHDGLTPQITVATKGGVSTHSSFGTINPDDDQILAKALQILTIGHEDKL